MATVACKFDNCGLHFVNKYELIYHVEEDHIPIIKKQRLQQVEELEANNGEGENGGGSQNIQQNQDRFHALYNQPLPMSLLCKLSPFPNGHGVRSVSPKLMSMNFCHYRKRPAPPSPKKTVTDILLTKSPQASPFPDGAVENGAGVIHSSPSGKRSTLASKRLPSSISGGASPSASVDTVVKPEFKEARQPSISNLLNSSSSAHIRNAHSSSGVSMSSSTGIGIPQRLSPAEESILSRQLPCSTQVLPSSPLATPANNAGYSANASSNSSTGLMSSPIHVTQMGAYSPVVSAGGYQQLPPMAGSNLVHDSGGYGAQNTLIQEDGSSGGVNSLGGSSSSYVIVSTNGGMGGPPAAVTTVRQVVQSQAAAAAAAAGSSSSSPFMQSGRYLSQRSSFTGKYQCQYCSKTYKTMMNLNKHVQESHPKQISHGTSYVSSNAPQQLLSSSPLVRAQSPRNSSGQIMGAPSRAAFGSTTTMIVPQQQASPPGSQVGGGGTISSYSPSNSPVMQSSDSQSAGLTLVAATPPPPSLVQQSPIHHQQQQYGVPKTPQHQQQYYVATAASPAQIQQQNRSQNMEHQYLQQTSSSYLTNPQQQPTTTIYVSQQSPVQLQHYTVTHTPLSQTGSQQQQQPSVKWMPWSEGQKQSRDGLSSGPPPGVQQQPTIIVGRAAQSQQSASSNVLPSRLSQQQQGGVNVQTTARVQQQLHQPQYQVPRSSQNFQSPSVVGNLRQTQYYQSPLQQQQHQRSTANVVGYSGAVTGIVSTTASMTSPASGTSNSSATTTIRVSSLNQFHQQQQTLSQPQQTQQQYVHVQQQPQQYSAPSSQQQQTVSISSQPPPPPQYQATGTPSFVVRTSSIHHQPSTRYVTQQQQQYGTGDTIQPAGQQQRLLSSHQVGASMASNRGNPSPAGGATMAAVGGGGGPTVYYRTTSGAVAAAASSGAVAGGQQVLLRSTQPPPMGGNSSMYSSSSAASSMPGGSGTTVRMVPVVSADYGQPPTPAQYQPQQQQYHQIVSASPHQQQQQPPLLQSHKGSYGSGLSRTRNARYATSGNSGVLLQSSQQAQPHQYGGGGGADESSAMMAGGQPQGFQSSSLPYASTAAAFAGADPSTPIRAIVSRGLVEQAGRYNYTSRSGRLGESGGESRVSLHYRTVPSSATSHNSADHSSKPASSPYVISSNATLGTTASSYPNSQNAPQLSGAFETNNGVDMDFRGGAPKLQPQTSYLSSGLSAQQHQQDDLDHHRSHQQRSASSYQGQTELLKVGDELQQGNGAESAAVDGGRSVTPATTQNQQQQESEGAAAL